MEKLISKSDMIISFGSCFATEMGNKLEENGYRILNNPFGVLFNPVSIANSINRLLDPVPFTLEDVIERDPLYGKNSGLEKIPSFASFFHHGSFRESSPELFLDKVNPLLEQHSLWLKGSTHILVTFGTSWVFREKERDIIVSNCHKRPAYEFQRELLGIEQITELYQPILSHPCLKEKQWIFTVSPIRHLSDGAHGNQISKATLLLAIEKMCATFSNAHYFPSYEIVLDELRDYKFFTQDKVHPTQEAINIVWERFSQEHLLREVL